MCVSAPKYLRHKYNLFPVLGCLLLNLSVLTLPGVEANICDVIQRCESSPVPVPVLNHGSRSEYIPDRLFPFRVTLLFVSLLASKLRHNFRCWVAELATRLRVWFNSP